MMALRRSARASRSATSRLGYELFLAVIGAKACDNAASWLPRRASALRSGLIRLNREIEPSSMPCALTGLEHRPRACLHVVQ